MNSLRLSIVIVFIVTVLGEEKLYKFDDYYETVVQGKAKLDAQIKFEETFDRKKPWGYFKKGLDLIRSQIDKMLQNKKTSTTLSAVNQLNLIDLETAFQKWMNKYLNSTQKQEVQHLKNLKNK